MGAAAPGHRGRNQLKLTPDSRECCIPLNAQAVSRRCSRGRSLHKAASVCTEPLPSETFMCKERNPCLDDAEVLPPASSQIQADERPRLRVNLVATVLGCLGVV